MKKILLALFFVSLGMPLEAQVQQEFPRIKVSFDGSATVESADFDGFLLFRTATTPNTSAAGTARLFFDGTRLRISENGVAFTNVGRGDGTVTSVGLSFSPGTLYTVSGSPVTTSGTLTATLATQTANRIFAGPATGAAAQPTFRLLVDADFPSRVMSVSKLAQSGCTTGANIEWNGTDWACGIDETTPGGTAWVTNGNAVTNANAVLGSTDNFAWHTIVNNQRFSTYGTDGSWTKLPAANAAATAVTTTVDSGKITLLGRYWTGAASADYVSTIEMDVTGTTPSGGIRFRNNAGTSTFFNDEGGNTTVGGSMTAGNYGDFSFYRMPARTSPGVSAAGQTRIYMDSTTNKVMISENGNAYRVLGGTNTYMRWFVDDMHLPSASYPTYDLRNEHPVLDFLETVTLTAHLRFQMPDSYDDTGVNLVCGWAATAATSGSVRWQAQFDRYTENLESLDTTSGATTLGVNATAPATNGRMDFFTISFTDAQMDGVNAGDYARIFLSRVGGDATDTMTGNAELVFCRIERP